VAIPIIGDIIKEIGGIVGKAVVDKDKAREIQLELEKLGDRADQRFHEQMIAQAETNKVEAAHPSVFVAGWRPFIGWSSGCAFIYSAIISPLFGTPPADLGFVQTILMGMLGIAGMRTFEKVKDVATDKITLPGPTYKKKKVGEPTNIIPENVPWMK